MVRQKFRISQNDFTKERGYLLQRIWLWLHDAFHPHRIFKLPLIVRGVDPNDLSLKHRREWFSRSF